MLNIFFNDQYQISHWNFPQLCNIFSSQLLNKRLYEASLKSIVHFRLQGCIPS